MAVNKHFHTSNLQATSSEQGLYANLVAEAIQIHGHDVYYLDRTLVAEDTVLGEDTLSKFRTQVPIEMYMEDSGGGFAGEKEIMNQFGLQNLSEATFVVSKTRFQDKTKQFTIEDATDTSSGGAILMESGTISTNKFEGSTYYLISETDATDSDRPLEGDAIFHPTLGKLFTINFVDHDDPFNQLDNNPVFKLRCRLFEYSSEALDTGITAIDAIEDALSNNTLEYQFTLQQSVAQNEPFRLERFIDDGLILDETDSDNIIGEDDSSSVGENIIMEHNADTGHGGWLIAEDYIIGSGGVNTNSVDPTAQNELFDELDDTVLDFSESNPFGDAGSS
jgi:hypothetical protein